MKKIEKIADKIFKFFSSIQLAMIIIFSLAVISATGTIYEARYDTAYAQKLIYHSPLMYFILGLLCVNLINVMIDRWPWKPHHAGFIFAHVGIVLLIAGSLVTKLYGIDGSLMFDIGQKNRYVSLNDTQFVVYASFGEGEYKLMHSADVDFITRRPEENPYEIQLGSEVLKIKQFYPWAVRDQKIVASSNTSNGPAVRIQLQNERVNLTQWLNRPRSSEREEFDLGPAKIILLAPEVKFKYESGNQVVLQSLSTANATQIKYAIYTQSRGGLAKQGLASEAETIDTGWMGLQLRLLKYLPHAEQKVSYTPRERPNGNVTSAVLIDYNGQETWVGLNSNVRVFSDDMAYLVSYRNKLIDLGFDMHLDKFIVGRYQGTNRAMSYESVVSVDGLGTQNISMNNPLKHQGYTFYQASFQENEKGEATTSILSVNRDPGRFLKYFGSLMIVLGTIIMFYFKHYRIKMKDILMRESGAS